MKMKLAALVLWSISLVITLAEDPAPAAPAPTPELTSHQKAAAKLVEMSNPREVFFTTFNTRTANLLAKVPDDKKPAFQAAMQHFAETIADSPKLKAKMIEIYTESFTEPELNEIIAFYNTPTGAKSLQQLPLLMQKGAAVGEEIAQENTPALQAELQKIMLGSTPAAIPVP